MFRHLLITCMATIGTLFCALYPADNLYAQTNVYDGAVSNVVPHSAALDVAANDNDFSVEFCIRPTQGPTGQYRSVVHKGNSDSERTFAIWLYPNDMRVHYTVSTTANGNEAINSAGQLALDQPTKLSYVRQGNKLKLYLNGTFDSEKTLGGQVVSNTGPLYIGKSPWYNGFAGQAADLVVYAYAITPVQAGCTIPSSPNSASPIRITEFMAANDSTLADEDGDFSDWIEIHNSGSSPVNLQGYGLSDDSALPNKWVFPNVTLNTGQHLTVFASSKSRAVAGGELHTNFKLSAGGEFLSLADASGNIISQYTPTYPQQYDDVSFGVNSSGERRYFTSPTPGSTNSGGIFPYNAAAPVASLARGFYSTPQSATLSSPTASTIRYTLDGSIPTATNGSIYTGPLAINQTTTLRVMGIDVNGQASDVVTFTYIFVDDVVDQGVPAGWSTEAVNNQVLDYGMDSEIVNGQREAVKQSLLSIPSLSIVTDADYLFDPAIGVYVNAPQKGDAWERPTSVEWLNTDNTPGFQIDAGLRMRGGASRNPSNPKHSFRLFFSDKYDGTLKYAVFGTEGVDTFKKIDLRTSQNYGWTRYGGSTRNTLLREIWSRDTQGVMGNSYTRSNYVHLYLNGHYWGLFMTQERVSEEYAQDYFGGKEDDYDVIKHRDNRWESDPEQQALNWQYYVTSGNDANWDTMWSIIQDQVVTDAEYQQLESLVDLDSLIDDQLIQIYGGNHDGTNRGVTANNWYALRDRTGNGVKWQFFSHDAEHTLGAQNHDVGIDRSRPIANLEESEYYTLEYFNPGWLNQALTSNAQYRSRFQYRAWQHMMTPNGALSPNKARERWDVRKAQVGPAILAESARWGDAKREIPYGVADWQAEVDWVEANWFSARTNITMNQLRVRNLATDTAPPSPATPAPPLPKMILNEYNAVDGSEALQESGSDTTFGTVQGNGGDWFELVTVVDNLDIRGWTVEIWDGDNFAGTRYRTDILQFANQPQLADLRRGTIVTIAEDVADDLSYDPTFGDWSINLQSNSSGDGAYFTAASQSNFDTNSKAWQLVIRDGAGNLVFGPVGEGIGTMAADGVGNQEIAKLEEDPSTAISAASAYNDGTTSTFGAPNQWANGTATQDFSTLRSVVPQRLIGDVNCDDRVDVVDALFIMQFEVSTRSGHSTCLPVGSADWLYLPAGDVNQDTNVTVIDALFIMQCEAGIANDFCP